MRTTRCILFLLFLIITMISCSTSTVSLTIEPDIDPYPQASRCVVYKNQGIEYFRSGISDNGDFKVPSNPVRENCTFNGWWITCNEGIVKLSQVWLNAHPNIQKVEANARWINTSYCMEQLSKMGNTQDGAIYGNYLMRFNASGMGQVFSMPEGRYLSSIVLDSSKLSVFKPHSNAVCFGNQYYDRGDEFPLLYTNVYNNYDVKVDRKLGTVGVYRITRDDCKFNAKLVQVIRIGFTSDKNLWMSSKYADKSPFGNMIVDTDRGKLWFFVTRDANTTTRFFCFDIPSMDEGQLNEETGVNEVVLQKEDIIDMFDIPYSNYLQGACYHDGKIYSTEGMGSGISPNVIRIVDLENKIEDCVIDFYANKYWKEAEFIDFYNDQCYFSDFTQTMYKLSGI